MMMVDTTIYLIGLTSTGETDEYLQPVKTETRAAVLAAAVPVSRSEYYGAGQLGIKPDYEFIINPAEYHGETIAEVTTETGETERVRIYRTYLADADQLEIYCQAAAGLDSVPDDQDNDERGD